MLGSTSSGFGSESFPAGLRVLVVDDDPTWLKVLEKMLKKCNYQVATCTLAQEALELLQERKGGFDIVISDVNMSDMDGFKFLEHVGLKMDLPVIMMSVDGETSRVMKGVQHGACDYLVKPIRMRELRNIWQHVFRKRIHEVRGIEGQESHDEIQMKGNGMEQSDDDHSFSGDMVSGKKRKDIDNKSSDRASGDPSSVKKTRVVWTVDLHQKFVKAVNQIGFDKVGPKKILDLMGVPWLTRENVASHLQKYRLYLSRLQKDNELKASCGGIKLSDISSKEPVGNICVQGAVSQKSVTLQKNIVINENYTVPGHEIHIHNHGANICEGNVSQQILSMPMAAEAKKALFGDGTADSPLSSTSRIGYNHSFELLDSQVKSESKIQAHYTWSAGVPSVQIEQEFKPHFQSEHHRFDHMPHHSMPVDFVSHNPRPCSSSEAADKPTDANISPSYGNNRGYAYAYAIGTGNTAALLSVQPQRHSTNCHILEPIPCSTWSTKKHMLDLHDNLEPSLKNIIVGTGSALSLQDIEFNAYSSPLNPRLVNFEPFGYSNQELIADVRSDLYDSENFDSEYPSDPVDLVMNQGLYLA